MIEVENIIIEPKCQALPGDTHFHETAGNIYISVQGYVFPCCWYGISDHMTTLWDESGIDKEWHNIHHHSLEEIINGPIFKWIEDNMHNIDVCQEKCVKENYDIHI